MPTNKLWTKAKQFLLHQQVALFAMLFTVLFVAKFQSNKWYEWDNPEETFRSIVRSDGAGYYAYLPQTFIYKENHFQFIDRLKKKYPESKLDEFKNIPEDYIGRLDKYFPGVSICQAPFFIAAHYFHTEKYDSDGYSLPYQKAMVIGAIFFLLLGLWLSYLVLLHFRIQTWIAAVSLTIFTLGSTLLYYSVNEILTAHAYSFTFVALFFYSLIRWKESCTLKWLLMVVFAYAMVILLRPSNGIVFLLFFAVFANLKEAWSFLINNLFKKSKRLIPAILLFVALIFIQFANVKYQTGHWGFNIYGSEGFDNWNNPPVLSVLFGFKKGLFIYTPLFLISLFGFWFFRKEYSFANKVVLLFLALFTYVTASWWCWWYGGSLGMRPFVDVSLVFMIGLAFLLQNTRNIVRILLIPLLVFCVYYQFILTIQLETGILHYAEMNKEKFKKVFLKTDNRFQWIFHTKEPKSFDDIPNVYNATQKWSIENNIKLIPFSKKIEHIQIENLVQTPITAKHQGAFGLRLSQSYKITDKHNLPWLYYDIKKDSVWTNIFVDYIGMRIPSLNESYHVNSDLFLTKEIKDADSLRIRFHNTNGLTTIEGWHADRLSVFKKK